MKTYHYLLMVLLLVGSACQKQENWLDEKVNRSSVVPTRLKDFSALLNADAFFQSYGVLGLISTDHIYVTDADYFSVNIPLERNGYNWAKEIYEGFNPDEWSTMYRLIEVSNVCLEGLEKIQVDQFNQTEWNRIKGTALFFRGVCLYNLMQFFSLPYEPATAATNLGVPIRLTSDVNIRPKRSNAKDCYDRITTDISEAINFLPTLSAFKSRPTKVAAQAMLARVYLTMEDWTKAEQYASLTLSQNQTLIDFNTLNANASVPFPTFQIGNPEVVQYAESTISNFYFSNIPLFDSILYRTYATNDLRRTVFFRLFNNQPIFKGFYTGVNMVPFTGIATNELFLIRAEALARLGQKDLAMSVLNNLLVKRWRSGTYINMTAIDAEDALQKIIRERRKELPFHGSLVWEDLRRLNRDSRFARTLKRVIAGITYELPPKDKRYTLPIPDIEIRLTGIQQNDR